MWGLLPPLVVVLLVVICSTAGVADAHQHQHLAYATDRACQSTSDCLAHGQWCRRGQFCANRQCYVRQDYPCRRRDEFCQEQQQRCVPVPACTSDKDCDDGLYCNGLERCIDGWCRNNQTFYCPHACSEATRSCLRQLPLVPVATAAAKATTDASSMNKTVVGTKTTSPTEAPTEAPTASDTIDPAALWTILFIAGAAVMAMALVMYIVTGAAKPSVPSTVVVITQSDIERNLLSSNTFQQKIHYQ